jgi:hypothetical protein
MKDRDERTGGQPPADSERELRHDAEADREYTTPRRARKADAGQPDAAQPMEPPEGKDPPARRGEDDQGRPVERPDRGRR